MRTSSSRLRAGAAVASTGLALIFALGAPAFAGDKTPGNGSGRPINTTPNDHPSGKDKNVEPGGSGTQGKSSSDPDGSFNGGADKPGGPGGFDADKDGNNGCGNDDDFEDDNNGNCGGLSKSHAKGDHESREEKDECVKASEMGQDHGKGEGLDSEKCDTDDEVTGNKDVKDTKDSKDVKDVKDAKETKDVDTKVTKVEDTKVESTKVETTVLGTELERSAVANTAPGAVLAADLQSPTADNTRVLGVSIERGATAAAPATAPTRPTAVLGATFTRGAALARTGFGLTLFALAGLGLVLLGLALKRTGRRSTI